MNANGQFGHTSVMPCHTRVQPSQLELSTLCVRRPSVLIRFDQCLIQCKGMNVYDAKEGNKMLIDKNQMAWYWYWVQADQGNDTNEGDKTVIGKIQIACWIPRESTSGQ
ncbi:hypothetical protein K439DRAFT_1636749 [Ramaria rubella]|nr:hypothetical protein K439DRAFT_1636749 [Ramaria rubella]